MNDSKNISENTKQTHRSRCPVSCLLDVLGDKWTLLVVRDLMLGKATYSDFQRSAEGIPTNILAERLKRLQGAGIINKVPYQERPLRYRYQLTNKGMDLFPVLSAMIDWGNRHIEDTISRDKIEAILAVHTAGADSAVGE